MHVDMRAAAFPKNSGTGEGPLLCGFMTTEAVLIKLSPIVKDVQFWLYLDQFPFRQRASSNSIGGLGEFCTGSKRIEIEPSNIVTL
jgi:hypothetical protein